MSQKNFMTTTSKVVNGEVRHYYGGEFKDVYFTYAVVDPQKLRLLEFNPDRRIEERYLKDLREDIRTTGLPLSPVMVHADGMIVVDGNRRTQASRELEIPGIHAQLVHGPKDVVLRLYTKMNSSQRKMGAAEQLRAMFDSDGKISFSPQMDRAYDEMLAIMPGDEAERFVGGYNSPVVLKLSQSVLSYLAANGKIKGTQATAGSDANKKLRLHILNWLIEKNQQRHVIHAMKWDSPKKVWSAVKNNVAIYGAPGA